MNLKEKIKECPFCGNNSIFFSSKCTRHGDCNITINCNKCDVEMTGYSSREDLIKKWNIRYNKN